MTGPGDDPTSPAPYVVLASGSATRRGMLEAAGVPLIAEAAAVDEISVKLSLQQEGAEAADAAEALAELKAHRVASRHPQAIVIGADQILTCDGRWFDKPQNRDDARAQLLALRNKTHRLETAAVIVRGGRRIWHMRDTASLSMWPFSEAFLDDYLDRMGEAVTASVGGYQVEGLGAQLFSGITGSHFTILGLPLLGVLDVLRNHGVLLR